ncbi:MAG: hypothetical protein VYE40_00680 [Myxococcota bacterium]|nr:hypothetical protein [Myxococcota bacterium]MEC9439593.1 hypothetical protein [Myxococcota bacterium]
MRWSASIRVVLCLFLVLTCVIASPGFVFAQDASDRGRMYVGAGVELWPTPDIGGHGYGLLTYQRDDLVREADIDLTFNTDTLILSARDFKLDDTIRLGGFVKGEARFAGLLIDYYEQGDLAKERGFSAGFIQGAAQLDVKDAPVFLQLELGGRRWFFQPLETTTPDLVLPPDMWVFEPKLRMTYWKIAHDASISDPHRHYWRVRGWGFGAELGSDYRENWRPWGQVEDAALNGEQRNNAGEQPIYGRAWLRAGRQLHDRFRLQASLFMALGRGEDDLTRVRVGGMNPYVVSLAGLPWASYLPENFGTAQLSTHVRLFADHEVGLLVDHMQLSEADARRTDYTATTDGLGASLQGIGLFGDFRWGSGWQVHARAGYAFPSSYLAQNPHTNVWFSLGKQIF